MRNVRSQAAIRVSGSVKVHRTSSKAIGTVTSV